MAERSQHRESGGLEGRHERPAMGYEQSRPTGRLRIIGEAYSCTRLVWSCCRLVRHDATMTTLTTCPPHRLAALFACLMLVATCGCGANPRRLLDEMSRAYRSADSYADDAVVRIRYVRNDTETDQTIPFRVVFDRPDSIRIDCYDARIAADGTALRAAVGSVPGQVLEEPVQSPLTLDQIFGDEQVRLALAEGDAGCPTQLPLLLADDTVDLILADAAGPPRITGTETIDGQRCQVVSVPKPDGKLVLWIDDETKLLRRMALPTGDYGRHLAEQGGPVGGLSVVVEFREARFAAGAPEAAFAFEVPAAAARVTRLEPPVTPTPPSALVSRPAPPFTLAGADGATITAADLAGAPAVLEFFHAACDRCGESMPRVAQAAKAFSARHGGGSGPALRHFAVSVDEADVPDAELREKLDRFGGAGTFVRDPRSMVAGSFEIESFPAVVVLAADGTVADVLQGPDQRIGADVAATLAAVAAGSPTAPLLRDRFESRLRDYRAALDRVAGDGTAERIPPQNIAPRRQPVRFKLVRAWRADRIALPGNVSCVQEGDTARVVALDGWRTVVELDAAGQETARHELDLPADAAVGFLRTAVDASGRRWWLGGERGGQHVFVFDDAWKLHATYPEWEGPRHAGIRTAQLLDCDGDGMPEIVVGYAGTVGVQVARLDGHRIWRDRSLDTVLDIVADVPREGGGQGLVCVDGRGRLVPLVPQLTGAAPISSPKARPGWTLSPPVAAVFAGPVAPDGHWAFLGLASPQLGKNQAVGLGPDDAQFWQLDLPDGVHRDGPIEPVAWADLLGTPRRQWLIASPDGSVTVLWADGRVVDSYRHGAAIVGLGGYRSGNDGFIVIATKDMVEGYHLDDVALD
jgi:outer membrane lipoprotein-sorting protein